MVHFEAATAGVLSVHDFPWLADTGAAASAGKLDWAASAGKLDRADTLVKLLAATVTVRTLRQR